MSVEGQKEIIKQALRLTFNDIDHLHEATGLFSIEYGRSLSRKQRYLANLPENSTLNSDLFLRYTDKGPGFDTELLTVIRSEHDRLLALTIEDLHKYVAEKQKLLDEAIKAELPFNRPEAKLETVVYWIRKSVWTPEEATLLAKGLEPRPELIKYIKNMTKYEIEKSEFALSYFAIFTLMESAIEIGEISTPGTPLEFLGWFEKVKFSIPDELKTGVFEIHAPERLDQINTAQGALNPKERESLLKLVIGMAIEQYGYDPRSGRNEATSNIATDLETNGVPLDRDTILKWLREGAKLLPNDPE